MAAFLATIVFFGWAKVADPSSVDGFPKPIPPSSGVMPGQFRSLFTGGNGLPGDPGDGNGNGGD